MTLALNIELSDHDIEHFTKAMDAARVAAGNKSDDEIVAAAVGLLENAQKTQVPDFIGARLAKLDTMIAMARDEGWALGDEDRARVMSALVYFADPKDVIPDSTPVLGFLDDAIMIELCVRQLKHEFDAYEDFCDYRQNGAEQRGETPAMVGRAQWLEGRRDELQQRMHRRREREMGTGYGNSSGYASKRSYLSSASWRPGAFKFL